MATHVCAHCAELFDASRLNCPHCGADIDLTWSDPEMEEMVAEPEDEDAAYERLLREEGLGGPESDAPPNWVPLAILVIAMALVLWFVIG